jgi:hypothetical protein
MLAAIHNRRMSEYFTGERRIRFVEGGALQLVMREFWCSGSLTTATRFVIPNAAKYYQKF